MPGAKLLYVLRHAKSSWEDDALPDHERPLSGRGRRAVALLAEHVAAEGIEPELVLCSSARRTRDTAAGVLPSREAVIEPELYDARPGYLIERLRRVAPDTQSVMLVGHNPAAQQLVLTLTNGVDRAAPHDSEPARGEIERKFPTGALATLELRGEWSELRPGGARLLDYVRPRSLS